MVDRQFIKLSNFRDLGGIKNKEGRTVSSRKLLRSGQLFQLPQEETVALESVYNVKTIVDLRRPIEADQSPNTPIRGAVSHNLDVSGNAEYSTSHEAFIEYLRTTSASDSLMASYKAFILSENAIQQYRRFFDLLLNQKEGAILWHCFAGKDRTGIAAMYLLTALGVEDEVIMEDYMLTNELRERENQRYVAELRASEVSEDVVMNYYEMLRVKPDYLHYAIDLIEDQYGSRHIFLEKAMGLTDDKVAKLKAMYLD